MRTAIILSVITVVYNIIEGVVSVYFGASDDALSLAGFGFDSFVEVISGLGVFHMLLRKKFDSKENPDRFEKGALYITGISFFILAAALLAGSGYFIYINNKPETTLPGVIISLVSIMTMWLLMRMKLKVGAQLSSPAIIADANCTKTCLYLSVILLAASTLYYFTGIGYLDSAGSLGIAYFAFSEGREAVGKARSGSFECGCGDNCSRT